MAHRKIDNEWCFSQWSTAMGPRRYIVHHHEDDDESICEGGEYDNGYIARNIFGRTQCAECNKELPPSVLDLALLLGVKFPEWS